MISIIFSSCHVPWRARGSFSRSILRDEDMYRRRRKTDTINRAGDMESIRTAWGSKERWGWREEEDRFSVSRVWKIIIVWHAEILDTLKSPSSGLCWERKRELWLAMIKKRQKRDFCFFPLCDAPVLVLSIHHFSLFSTAFFFMGLWGAGAYPRSKRRATRGR